MHGTPLTLHGQVAEMMSFVHQNWWTCILTWMVEGSLYWSNRSTHTVICVYVSETHIFVNTGLVVMISLILTTHMTAYTVIQCMYVLDTPIFCQYWFSCDYLVDLDYSHDSLYSHTCVYISDTHIFCQYWFSSDHLVDLDYSLDSSFCLEVASSFFHLGIFP